MPPIYLLTSPHGWDESGKPFSPRGVGTAYIYNHWPFDNQYILSSMYTAIVQDDNQTHRPFRLIIRSNQKKIKLWNDIALTGYGLVHNLHYRSNVPPPKIISPLFEFVAFDKNSTSLYEIALAVDWWYRHLTSFLSPLLYCLSVTMGVAKKTRKYAVVCNFCTARRIENKVLT